MAQLINIHEAIRQATKGELAGKVVADFMTIEVINEQHVTPREVLALHDVDPSIMLDGQFKIAAFETITQLPFGAHAIIIDTGGNADDEPEELRERACDAVAAWLSDTESDLYVTDGRETWMVPRRMAARPFCLIDLIDCESTRECDPDDVYDFIEENGPDKGYREVVIFSSRAAYEWKSANERYRKSEATCLHNTVAWVVSEKKWMWRQTEYCKFVNKLDKRTTNIMYNLSLGLTQNEIEDMLLRGII